MGEFAARKGGDGAVFDGRGGFEAVFQAAFDFLLPAFGAEFGFAVFGPGTLADGGIKDFGVRMAGRNVAGIAVFRVFDDGPGIAFRVAGMGMMGTGEIGKGRVIGAVRRGVQGAVRTGHVGMVMDAGLPLVAEGVVGVPGLPDARGCVARPCWRNGRGGVDFSF